MQQNPKLYIRFLGVFSIQAEGPIGIRAAKIPIIVVSLTVAALFLVAAARAGPELTEMLTNRISWIFTPS